MSSNVRYRYCELCGPTDKSTFRFPANKCNKRDKWLAFCNRSSIDELHWPFLCEKHFEESFIIRSGRRNRLHISAIPTKKVDNEESRICVNYSSKYLSRASSNKESTELPSILEVDVKVEDDTHVCTETGEAYTMSCSLGVDAEMRDDNESIRSDAVPREDSIETRPTSSQHMRCLGEINSTTASCFLEVDTEMRDDNESIGSNVTPRKSGSETTPMSSQQHTHRSTNHRKYPNPRCLGEINTPTIESPSARRNCLRTIRYQNALMLRKFRNMKMHNKRRKDKIASLKELVQRMHNTNKISEDAASILLVNITKLYNLA